MDLGRLKKVTAEWQTMTPEERAETIPKVEHILAWMNQKLPALNELDKAAVADYIAQLMSVIYELPLKETPDLLFSTTIGYGVASAHYLGWINLGATDA